MVNKSPYRSVLRAALSQCSRIHRFISVLRRLWRQPQFTTIPGVRLGEVGVDLALCEGRIRVPFPEVSTADGSEVKASRRGKYKQVEEFLRLVELAVNDAQTG